MALAVTQTITRKGGKGTKYEFEKCNSPFRYAGGKFYAWGLILPEIPMHTQYCEPFAGGASIFFAKSPAQASILNDLDAEVMNTFVQIRDNVGGLISMLSGIPARKELHAYYKNEYEPTTALERAFRWYYLNRTSYSGIMRTENCYWGYGPKVSMRPENWPRHLRKVPRRLQGVDLLAEDFEVLIDRLPDGFFLLLDPPYFNADQHKFYTCTFTKENHARLAQCLKRHQNRLKFLITYDDCEVIVKLYDWIPFHLRRTWNYTGFIRNLPQT